VCDQFYTDSKRLQTTVLYFFWPNSEKHYKVLLGVIMPYALLGLMPHFEPSFLGTLRQYKNMEIPIGGQLVPKQPQAIGAQVYLCLVVSSM
jgi:hypothetical protein